MALPKPSRRRPGFPLRRSVSHTLAFLIMYFSLAVTGCAVPGPETASPAPFGQGLARAHPPATGEPVVIDERVRGWRSVAWLAAERFCIATTKSDASAPHVHCGPIPGALLTDGLPVLASKPVPQVVPIDTQADLVLLVGTVRGAVATVDVTLHGNTASGRVYTLPNVDDRLVGAYAVWVSHKSVNGENFTSSDISAVVARDTSGNVVSRLS